MTEQQANNTFQILVKYTHGEHSNVTRCTETPCATISADIDGTTTPKQHKLQFGTKSIWNDLFQIFTSRRRKPNNEWLILLFEPLKFFFIYLFIGNYDKFIFQSKILHISECTADFLRKWRNESKMFKNIEIFYAFKTDILNFYHLFFIFSN